MKKKVIIFSFIFLVFSVFFYKILISEKCKSKEFLLNLKVIGINVLTECYNEVDIKENIKKISKTNKNLYNFLSFIKIKFFPEYGKSRDIYQLLEFNKTYKKKNFSEVKNLKGIISNEKLLKKYHSEFDNSEINLKTWERSHGNNWNTKYFDANLINKNNINKIKLKWKYDPIKISNSKKKWKSRIGINPIYADGIVYFVSANWELIALTADNGKLIWSKNVSI